MIAEPISFSGTLPEQFRRTFLHRKPQPAGAANTLAVQLPAATGANATRRKQLVNRYERIIAYWCYKAHVPSEDIPDVVQDVFLRVLQKLDDFRPNGQRGAFEAWLRCITRSAVATYFRVLGRQPKLLGPRRLENELARLGDAAGAAAGFGRDVFFVLVLRQVQAECGRRAWAVFWRIVVEERSSVDVAAEMNMTPEAVRKCKSRVLERLRQLLADATAEERR